MHYKWIVGVVALGAAAFGGQGQSNDGRASSSQGRIDAPALQRGVTEGASAGDFLPAEFALPGRPRIAPDYEPGDIDPAAESTPVIEEALAEVPFELNPAPWQSAPVASEAAQAALPFIDAVAAIVIDEASGATLWERNAHTPLPPASLTKIATAIVALERGDLERWVQVDVDWREMPGSSVMGLERGEWFQMQDLLYGLMLPSGNDAALAIGRDVSGSDAAFVDDMNELVARLGLNTAHFANPHGLGTRNRISAHDLAHLGRYAMSIEEFRPLSSTRYHVAHGHTRNIALGNLNGILLDVEGGDGIKVGYTYRAGKTLVASATRDGNRVFAVLLNAPSSRADGAKLLEWAFANHTWEE